MMTEPPDYMVGRDQEQASLKADVSPPDRELLAAMVSSNGHGHKLAGQLLSRFGSVAAIAKAHPTDLTAVDGIGEATAARLAAAFQLAHRAIGAQPPIKLDSEIDIADAPASGSWW
jgi:DNA repair protein RadC